MEMRPPTIWKTTMLQNYQIHQHSPYYNMTNHFPKAFDRNSFKVLQTQLDFCVNFFRSQMAILTLKLSGIELSRSQSQITKQYLVFGCSSVLMYA